MFLPAWAHSLLCYLSFASQVILSRPLEQALASAKNWIVQLSMIEVKEPVSREAVSRGSNAEWPVQASRRQKYGAADTDSIEPKRTPENSMCSMLSA